MENTGNQSEEAVGDPPPPTTSTQEQSTSESSSQPRQEHRPPPPLSPLTGSYLLIVVGEPHSERHKEIILQKIAKAFLSWDVNECHVSLEKELQVITGQSPEGEEARYGERLIQYATENLVTEILIHPQLNTLHQCLKNLLSSFTKHRHIIHAGYTFAGNGSWILQDGTLSISDLVEALHEPDVLRVLKAYENSVSIDVHCAPEGDWTTERFQKEPVSKLCNIRINPGDVMTAGNPAILAFTDYLSPFLEPANIQQLLQPTDVVGNIRFTHPTLYVFPGGQGDAALFGINGFNMLIDGGFARKACFWDFARHLDRLDAVLLTRLNNSTVNGISAVLQRKKMNHVYPQIGHFFCNLQDRKIALSPDGDKDKDSLIVNLAEEGQEIVANLRHLALKPHPCYRDGNQVDPVNLYHKVGHGKLDMYVISPARDSQAVKEFLAKWSSNDSHLFSNTGKKLSGKSFEFPLQNLVSICALLVWQPANPNDTITRILFPGSTPQHKIFEGLEKLRHLEFLKHPVCSAKSISPSVSTTTVTRSLSKTRQSRPVDTKQKETKVITKPQVKPAKPKVEKTSLKEMKAKLDNKLADEKNGLENVEEPLKKLDNRLLSKDEQIENIKKEIQKIELAENEEQKKKIVHRSKYDMRNVKSKVDSRAPSKSVDRKKPAEKKPDGESSPPATPKKGLTNGTATKAEKAKAVVKPGKASSPTSTPAKSAKEANNRKVVEARVTTRAAPAKAVPKKKEETPPPPSSAVAKTERKPISRRPKAPLSPVKSSTGKPKPEPEPVLKTIQKKTEIETTVIKALSQTISKGLEKDIETKKTEEDEGKIEIKLEKETTENKETDTKAVKNEMENAQTERNKEDEEEEEEEEYLIITKEDYGEESAKEDESGKENEEEVQTKDETEGEGEIKKLLKEEEESEKKREIHEKEDLREEKEEKEGKEKEKTEINDKIIEKLADEEKEKVADVKKSESPVEKTPEGRESELQRLMEVDEGIDLKEPVSKEHKEGESLPEEKMSNTLETSATTAPTLPEDERIEEPVEQNKGQTEDVKEVIEEKYIQEKTKEEKQEEIVAEPAQPEVPLNVDVEGSSIPRQPNQRKHPRDVVKTPDEVAELPVHEEVDPRMYSSGDFTKEFQRKPEDEKQVKLDFKATIKGEANFLDEDETESEGSKKPSEELEQEPEKDQEQIQDPVITKYLNIIDELEKSVTDSKKDLEEGKEPKEIQEQFTVKDVLEEKKRVVENAAEKLESVDLKKPSLRIEDADTEKISDRTTHKEVEKSPSGKSTPLDLEKDVSGKSTPQILEKDPSGKSTPLVVENVASGKSTPLDLEKEISGKTTPQELEKEASERSTPQDLEKELSRKSAPLDLKKEISEVSMPEEIEKINYVSGKSTPQDLEKVSRKSTPIERENEIILQDLDKPKSVSGKSTPQDLEKISGKSTPLECGKEISDKSALQDLKLSGETTPQDLDKKLSTESLPQDLIKEILEKSSPQSGKSTPQNVEKDLPNRLTPQELEKSSPDKSSLKDFENSIPGESTAQDLTKVISEKSMPVELSKIASEKSTPQNSEADMTAKCTPADLEKEVSRGSTPHTQEGDVSGRSTPMELTKLSDKTADKDLSEKSSPQDLVFEKTPPKDLVRESTSEDLGKTKLKESEKETASSQETPKELVNKSQSLSKETSGKSTPEELSKEFLGESTVQDLNKEGFSDLKLGKEIVTDSVKSTPPDLAKEISREPTPQNVTKPSSPLIKEDFSGKSTPQDLLEKVRATPESISQQVSLRSTPNDLETSTRESEKLGSGRTTPGSLEKSTSGKTTPEKEKNEGDALRKDKDESEKTILHDSSQTEKEKNVSGKITPVDADKSGKITPSDLSSSRRSSEVVPGKFSPCEDEKALSGKSSHRESLIEGSPIPSPQISQKEPVDVLIREEKTDEQKDKSGKTSPQTSETVAPKSSFENVKEEIDKKPVIETNASESVSSGPGDKDLSGKSTPSSTDKEVSGKILPLLTGKATSDSFSLAFAEKGTSETYSLEKENSEKVLSPSPVDISPLSLDELKDDVKEKQVSESPIQKEEKKSISESHVTGKAQLELLKYEVGSSGTSTPDRSHYERSDASLPNGMESEDEPEKGILESERQEKESQILDISSGEEEELKALGDDEDSEPEIRKDDLEGRIFAKDIGKNEKDDINKLVQVVGGSEIEEELDVDGKTTVKRMLVTASSEDGGMETEISIRSNDKVLKKEKSKEDSEKETSDGDFSNLILQARKEYVAQRSRKTSCNSSEEVEELEEPVREREKEEEEKEKEEKEDEDEEDEEELGSLLKQARRELAFVRSKNRKTKELETEKSETIKTTTRSETTRMEDDDVITITTILTEEREEQEDGSIKITKTKETTSTGGKDKGTVVTVSTNFEKEDKKQDEEESSSPVHSSGERRPDTKTFRENGERKTSQEEFTETSRRTSASSIISQEDLVSRKDSAKLEDFRQSSTEMSPLKTTYITSHGDSESLMTSSFYGNLPTEDEMIGRAEHLKEFRKGRGYESFTEVGPNGERTERTYFYGSEDEPKSGGERSRFVKAYYTEGGQQKDGEQSRFVHKYYASDIPEEETVERTPFVQQFYAEDRSKPEPEGKFRFVETVCEEPIERMDFAKAIDEHVSARGEYLGKEFQEDVAKYSSGKAKKETDEEVSGSEGQQSKEKKEDVIASWGKPLGLPLPPKNMNKAYAFHGQNISATSTLSTPTDNSDSISNWGHPMNLPSPPLPPTLNGTAETPPPKATSAAKETPKKEKKIQAKKTPSTDNKSSGTNTPNRRSESPVKQIERRTPSTGRGNKSAASSHVYLDLTYVPHHGNSYYSNVEFFKKVRARYYVFSGTEPSKEVYNALLEAKQTWEDKKLEVTIIPTYDTDVLGYWVAENEEILAKHKIDLSPSASRCTINLQDHETSCSAYRLEF